MVCKVHVEARPVPMISYYGGNDNTCSGKPIRSVIVKSAPDNPGVTVGTGALLYPNICYEVDTVPQMGPFQWMKCKCNGQMIWGGHNAEFECTYFRHPHCLIDRAANGAKIALNSEKTSTMTSMERTYAYAGSNALNGNCFSSTSDDWAKYFGNNGKMWVVTNMELPWGRTCEQHVMQTDMQPHPNGYLQPLSLKQKLANTTV